MSGTRSLVVAATYTYDAFGNLMSQTGSLSQPFKFSTKLYDEQTGLSYFGYRFYSPAIGRWMTQDPIGYAGGLNLYGYVGNDPTNWIDKLGLDKYVIIVGDPGLGPHNVGSNFDRAAETRANELRTAGNTVDTYWASSVIQFNLAITTGHTIDGGVIYYGHGSFSSLFIGQESLPDTNLNSFTISELSNRNLGPNATIELNSCNSGRGDDSIAQAVATQLGRKTFGWKSPLGFSGAPSLYLHGSGARPPETGPLYVVPTPEGRMVPFSPRR